MSEQRSEPLSTMVGGAPVAENLRRAVATGALVEHEDGTLELGAAYEQRVSERDHWLVVRNGPPLGCDFLSGLLFQHAYARSAVPNGCRDCYKVKVAPPTLRGLFAGLEIARTVPCLSKWGTDLGNQYSQDIYAGYFYASGLDAARVLFRDVRPRVDHDPRLGPDVPITIKRGCSEYEAALGPSDRYTFAPELPAIEAALKARFIRVVEQGQDVNPFERWLDVAFRVGDDTYLDFTGGKRLRPPMVAYDPESPVPR